MMDDSDDVAEGTMMIPTIKNNPYPQPNLNFQGSTLHPLHYERRNYKRENAL
jgi:hypothetical protein